MYRAKYIHCLDGVTYEEIIYADSINEASRLAFKSARKDHVVLTITKVN